MNISMTIKAIEELVHEFEGQSNIEKLIIYSTIQTLLGELRNYASSKKEDGCTEPNVNIILTELVTPLRCLAGLENNGHSESQNVSWVRIKLNNLSSGNCFNA